MYWHVTDGRADGGRFMGEAPVFVKWLLSKYDDIETYMTKSMNPDGGMVYSYYKEGASYPTFVYVKAGYKIAKVRPTVRFVVAPLTDWHVSASV